MQSYSPENLAQPAFSQNASTKPRQSNLELLRIIAMFLIVMHHFACHGLFDGFSSPLNEIMVKFMVVGGKVGVNIFVLISGYFMINSKFKLSKLLMILLQTTVYAFFIYIIFVISGGAAFDFGELVLSLLPLLNQYWFVTAYLAMYILAPYMNILIAHITRRQHISLIGFLLVLQMVIPQIFKIDLFGNSMVVWFLTLYLIATYLRKYGSESSKLLDSKIFMLIAFIASYALMAALNCAFNIVQYDTRDILCVLSAITLFCLFRKINIKSNKFINIVASSTLGIYLIHDNNFIRGWLWPKLINCPSIAYNNLFALYAPLICIAVFVVCAIIELIRKYLIEKPLFKGVNRLLEKRKSKKLNK